VAEIRRLRGEGASVKGLARRFGVCRATARALRRKAAALGYELVAKAPPITGASAAPVPT
jgi:hypothetical protein